MSSAIANERNLQYLYLEGNAIGDEGCAALAALLSSPSCPIKELYLGDNAIGPAGAQSLAECLRVNKIISTIYLEGNSLGDKGVTAFCEILDELKDSTVNLKLYVENNTEISKEVSSRLVNALRRKNGSE